MTTVDPTIVSCRYCGQPVGVACRRMGREPSARTHFTRIQRAERAAKTGA